MLIEVGLPGARKNAPPEGFVAAVLGLDWMPIFLPITSCCAEKDCPSSKACQFSSLREKSLLIRSAKCR